MELEDLKRRWEDQDRKLDAIVRLNTGLLRESKLGKTATALGRLAGLLLVGLLLDLGVALWLGSFLAEQLSEMRFLLPGAGLLLGLIALAIANVRQLVAIRQVDYAAPIVAIQRRLESLRVERLRAVKWTLLLAPLAWTPLLIVTLKDLLGVDAYATFGAPWLTANLAFGLVVIAFALWISRRYADRMERAPFVQRLMRNIAGHNLAAAATFLGSLAEFEREESRH